MTTELMRELIQRVLPLIAAREPAERVLDLVARQEMPEALDLTADLESTRGYEDCERHAIAAITNFVWSQLQTEPECIRQRFSADARRLAASALALASEEYTSASGPAAQDIRRRLQTQILRDMHM